MTAFFHRIVLSWKYIVKKAAEWTGVIYAFAGPVSLLCL